MRLFPITIMVLITLCCGMLLRKHFAQQVCSSTLSPVPSPSVEKEWRDFTIYLSQIESVIHLKSKNLYKKMGTPLNYQLFVNKKLFYGGKKLPDLSSIIGEKDIILWYPAPMFFNVTGMHWILMKNDKVASEAYIYDPISTSNRVPKNKVNELYFGISWYRVLSILGLPKALFIEIKDVNSFSLRLRYEDAEGSIVELVGDVKQVKDIKGGL